MLSFFPRDSTDYWRGGLFGYNGHQLLTKFMYYLVLGIDERISIKQIMWNEIQWMAMLTSVTMTTNYCDLMIIDSWLNSHHPYKVMEREWMDKKWNKYRQALCYFI